MNISNDSSPIAAIPSQSLPYLRNRSSGSIMSTDHHYYQPGPTLPPLRPFSFPPSHQVTIQHSNNPLSHSLKRPAQSASPIPQSNQTSSSPSSNSSNPVQHCNFNHPPQQSEVYACPDGHQDKQPNPAMSQATVDRRNTHSPTSSDRGNVSTRTTSQVVSSSSLCDQKLKRTASRAELNHQPARAGDKFSHSEVPPRLLADHQKSKHDHPKSHSQVTPESGGCFKSEYLTPHLAAQPLPSQSNNSPVISHSNSSNNGDGIHSPDYKKYTTYFLQPPPIHNPNTSHLAQNEPENPIKKRRMNLLHERALVKPCNGNSFLTFSDNSSSSPEPQTASQHLFPQLKHNQTVKDPVVPLAVGFIQPQHPTAMQQVANTIKLREEQKRLIEQRRKSFAGHSCLNPVSFSSSTYPIPPVTIGLEKNESSNLQISPHGTWSNIGTSASISEKFPPTTRKTNKKSFLKLPGDTAYPTPISTYKKPQQLIHTSSHHNINASYHCKSISHQQYQEASQNQKIQHSLASIKKDTSNTYPKPCISPGCVPTIASRRGQKVEEKVQKMALQSQHSQVYNPGQPLVKSAPICSSFLQVPISNIDVITTNTTVQQGLLSEKNAPEIKKQSETNFNSHPSHPSHKIKKLLHHVHDTSFTPYPDPGQPQISSVPYNKGLERRRTMHAGSLIQLPTLGNQRIKPNKDFETPTHSRIPQLSNKTNLNNKHPHLKACSISGSSHQKTSFINSNKPQYQHKDNMNDTCSTSHHRNSPLFPKAPGHKNHHSSASRSPNPQEKNLCNSNGSTSSPGIPPKHMFLQLFETFYNSLSEIKILQSNLEDQNQRSGQLIKLLQQSSGVFDKMHEERNSSLQKDFTRDIQVLESRIQSLEARTGTHSLTLENDHCQKPHQASNARKKASNPNATRKSPEVVLSMNSNQNETRGFPRRHPEIGSGKDEMSIFERLEKLEREVSKRFLVQTSKD